jgi:2-polyprenyl-3-methyl-5-hydroxy-6-metoxy-1,4-benzoquinol methylase
MDPNLKINNCCHVCGYDVWETMYQVKDFNQNTAGSWDIIVCKQCGLGCLNPFPRPSETASFYDDQFYTSDNKRFSTGIEFVRKLLACNRVRLIKQKLPPTGHILDLGSGAGHFGNMMAKRGWTVSNEDIAYAEHGRLRMKEDKIVLDYPNDFFDAVSLWYVIEHMINPKATFKEVFRILKPRGILITAQQNFSSYQAMFFGPNWLILDPPRHIFQFSQSNLTQLAIQEGFRQIAIEHRSIEFGPFTILQSALNMLLGNQNYLFKLLKNKRLKNTSDYAKLKKEKRWGIVSVVLSVAIAPFAFAAYFILLWLESGDVFTLFLQKDNIKNAK